MQPDVNGASVSIKVVIDAGLSNGDSLGCKRSIDGKSLTNYCCALRNLNAHTRQQAWQSPPMVASQSDCVNDYPPGFNPRIESP